jgi:succinate dehydrogenase / fumarate reductase membrane anchor subunit
MKNPFARERGAGHPGGGSQHWLSQRYSALILLLLTPWLLWRGVSLVGADYAMASNTMSSPSTAAFVIFFAGMMLYHAQLGLQVVIEDYVHIAGLESALQFLVRFGCLVVFLISTLAALKLVLA